MKGKKLLLFLLALLLVSQSVLAETKLVSNSADWKDVYSTMLYGSLMGVNTAFLTSARHSTILLYSIPKDSTVEVISSRKSAFVVGYDTIIEGRGFPEVTEYSYDNVNLELAKRLEGVSNFVVIDPSYGYNAISASPYAIVSNSYVLFADERTIDDVAEYLDDVDVDSLLLFGQLDREVKEELARYDPELLNEGDRFDNNIAIQKKFLEIKPKKQVTLSNGEFIESGLMTGAEPVVFIGRTNVPDQVRQFIDDSDIEVGVLVGNELIGTATYVRRQLGISVFVKFAQGSRTPSGSIAPVEDLDRFPMPIYSLNLDAVSMLYNKGTNSLEVTFRNLVDLATYFKSTITLTDATGSMVVGDEDALFIDGEEYKTVVYTETNDGDPIELEGDNITGALFTIYGEGRKSLEFTLEKEMQIETVTVLDNADIDIVDLVYNKRAKRFEVKLDSVGSADAYVNVELIDVMVNDEFINVGSEGVDLIKKGKSKWIHIKAELTDEDILENAEIIVKAYYGERENALIKIKTRTFAFKEKGIDYMTYVLVAVLIILIILFFFTKKKKCKNCGHKNKKSARTCKKCGAGLQGHSHQGPGGHPGHKVHHTMHQSTHTTHSPHKQ
ncbi:MAG: zinc ribbon domain-containing protein [Nanoarchaeota archaeon]|nr:zinc ribbon domain-containing protein [Nanoarchaeota archaeon]